MRPPEFTGGNVKYCLELDRPLHEASMRPPEFTGGNAPGKHRLGGRRAALQ